MLIDLKTIDQILSVDIVDIVELLSSLGGRSAQRTPLDINVANEKRAQRSQCSTSNRCKEDFVDSLVKETTSANTPRYITKQKVRITKT